MKTINKVVITISIIIALSLTAFFVKYASGDDNSGCKDANDVTFLGEMTGSINCYIENIYHQNQLLIQEHNQTNHLLAYQYCEIHFQGHTDDWLGVPTSYDPSGIYYHTFNNCTKSIMEMTK